MTDESDSKEGEKSDKRRDDVDTKTHFRTAERFLKINDQWWFAAREGDQGPFPNRDDAERAAAIYAATQDIVPEEQERLEQEVKAKKKRRGDPSIWDNQPDVD